MKTSIFKKQLVLLIGILLLSFTVLAVAFGIALQTHYYNQTEKQLLSQGEIMSKTYALPFYMGVTNYKTLAQQIKTIDDYYGVSTIVLNSAGQAVVVSSKINNQWVGQKITVEDIQSVLEGNIVVSKGNMLGGVFAQPVLTVCYPIKFDENVLGAVIMNSSIPDIQKTIFEVYKISIFCLAFSILLGFVLIYFSIKRISKPLLEMNNAAKVIASGDFEKRINIKNKDEVGQLANSFNEMAVSLNEQDELRRNFLSSVSHDIRTPLTSIQGFLNAIIDGTVPEDMQSYYLNIVLDETKRLSNLANNILDLNKIQGKDTVLELSEFDINVLIRNVVIQFEARIKEKNMQIKLILDEKQTLVEADKEKICRVLYNLIDNAIKFTNNNGEIIIETKVLSARVYLFVKDNGIGMLEEEKKHVFDRFYKADSSRGMDTKGSGLGLSIVRDLLKAHNETIEVKSTPGIGTAFKFGIAKPAEKDDLQ